MGGTTTNGYPYVTPDDHPLQFPAHSQALANKLQVQHPLTGFAVRSSDGTSGAGVEASVVSTTVVGATGRAVIVTGGARIAPAAVTNITVTLRCGATPLASYTLGTQESGVELLLPIAWTGPSAPADTFFLLATSSAGVSNYRVGSYLTVTAV